MTIVATQVWTDPFTYADGPIPAPWDSEPDNVWQVAGDPYNVAYPNGGSGGQAFRTGAAGDVRFDAQLKVNDSGDTISGIAVRASKAGGGTWLGAEIVKTATESKVVLYSRFGGADVERRSVAKAFVASALHWLRIDVVDDVAQLYVDDVATGDAWPISVALAGTDVALLNFPGGATNFTDSTLSTLADVPDVDPDPAPWLPDADVRRHIAMVSTEASGNVDDARLGAAAVVERCRPDLDVAGVYTPPADVKLAGLMLAARFYARRGSPMGVASYAEMGAAQIVRTDPDVAMLLGLGRFAKPKVR